MWSEQVKFRKTRTVSSLSGVVTPVSVTHMFHWSTVMNEQGSVCATAVCCISDS